MNPNREAFLISKAIDRTANDGDWQELETLGSTDVALWKRLADTLRTEDLVRRAVERSLPCQTELRFDALHALDVLDSPAVSQDAAPSGRGSAAMLPWSRVATIAASIVLAATLGFLAGRGSWNQAEKIASRDDVDVAAVPGDAAHPREPFAESAGTGMSASDLPGTETPAIAAEAGAYGNGRGSMRALPAFVVAQRPSADGSSVEVYYVCGFLGKATAREVLKLCRDEHGQLVPRRVEVSELAQRVRF